MSAIGTLTTHHVGLNVTDLDRSLAFYGDVLGFETLGKGAEGESRFAFLGQDDRLVLTLWEQAGEAYAPARAGLHHLAFEAASLDHVRAAEAALTARGATFAYEGVVAHREGAASGGIFFHDPDGTRLEISVPQGAQDAEAPNATAPTCGFF
ncbi:MULTISPECIES: VOC family protein [Streptomyces]|uniref:Lactoylglutathione lyase n=1 Tax=Streptomyces venezuelae (strain ATCC 10712 / CBS 650.69 / DSM 40230 / JCM 4526 / NBRC 13096 / PD 04745) TaxID=953739 RepID=F2R2G1_STRVP|nr:VOC family protein [Streptomyces venezuelae]APE21653.1 glyoxalase [Streptomyces venezuelae]QER99036.1 VOC family protein [Streptomyces venezuelae ATCC 10712]QES06127.1 VOC family protein [Streptomyces venezuelae]CCA55710.1 lactoylglutathione lyase [Streptomyces venezuelae ATCC 10712]